MGIPIPPHAIPTLQSQQTLKETQTNTLGSEKRGELSTDEYGFILDTTLKEKHRSDQKILEFIDSFIRCKNISQASAECGVHASLGYKWRHAKDIHLAIQKLIDRSAVKYGFDASEIIERTKELVDFDPIQLQNRDGSFKSNLHDVAPEARRNLKKLKVKNLWGEVEDINGVKTRIIVGEVIEYEFYDKLKAIDLVGKEKDMFKTTTKVEHTISNEMASILLDSAKRGAQASLEMKRVIEVQGRVIDDGE